MPSLRIAGVQIGLGVAVGTGVAVGMGVGVGTGVAVGAGVGPRRADPSFRKPALLYAGLVAPPGYCTYTPPELGATFKAVLSKHPWVGVYDGAGVERFHPALAELVISVDNGPGFVGHQFDAASNPPGGGLYGS